MYMKKIIFLALLLSTYCLASCVKNIPLTKIEGFAQGTTYHISFVLKNTAEKKSIEDEITAELNRLDKAISNYRDDSDIEQFNAQQNTDPHSINEEIISLIETARSISTASSGCYDLTIKPLFDVWGFKKDKFNLPSDTALKETLEFVGMDKLETLDKNHLRKTIPYLRIDLSSIGQGYSVERLARILETRHIENYLVEIGGELKARGKKPDGKAWRIALEKPLPNERTLEKIVSFDSGEPMSLMTSGTYRHYFDNKGKRYSHIIDAHSGKPVEHNTVSVTVLHHNPTLADAWSTALLCLGSAKGLEVANQQGIAALYIDQEGEKLVEQNTHAFMLLKAVTFETIKEN